MKTTFGQKVLKRGFAAFGAAPGRARVLVVGSGRMGHIRTSLLYANPRFDIAGIVDVNHQGAMKLADTYRTKPYESLEHALDDNHQSIDGIVVSSPTFTHQEVISTAAENGISVFTEKPVDETADKIKRLFELARRSGIDLCCGFQRRFDASYIAASQAVQTGKTGHPISANIFFADHPCPPKEFLLSGGNIFMDLSAHDVDFIMHALNDVVVNVYATGSYSTDELEAAGVHDNATMVMKFSRGTVVTLFMSRSATYGYDQRCEIFGDQGMVSVGNQRTHSTTLANGDGFHQAKLKHSFQQRFDQGFASELDAFADTLLFQQPWPVTGDDCIRVQKVADAARLSCEFNQSVTISYEEKEEDDDNDTVDDTFEAATSG